MNNTDSLRGNKFVSDYYLDDKGEKVGRICYMCEERWGPRRISWNCRSSDAKKLFLTGDEKMLLMQLEEDGSQKQVAPYCPYFTQRINPF